MKSFFFTTALFILSVTYAQEDQVFTEYYNYVNVDKDGDCKIKIQGLTDKNGFAIGEWKHFLKDGTLKYIINHDNNISKEFYKTGELKDIGTFNPDTGEHLGEWISYNKKGLVISKENFKSKEIY